MLHTNTNHIHLIPLFSLLPLLYLLPLGEQVSLQINGSDFTDSEWFSCTADGCSVGTCPGKFLRDDDLIECPNYIFTLYKVKLENTSSRILRVGDSIVLEHLPLDSLPPDDNTEVWRRERRRLFVACNPTTQSCSLSSSCVTEANRFNASYCRENVLVVRVQGKEVGEIVTHRDLLGFEFETLHNPYFDEQCALGCNPVTKTCSKKLCVVTDSNSLLGGVTEEAPQCGKDMFFIKKF